MKDGRQEKDLDWIEAKTKSKCEDIQKKLQRREWKRKDEKMYVLLEEFEHIRVEHENSISYKTFLFRNKK